jgi:hypothetical protein
MNQTIRIATLLALVGISSCSSRPETVPDDQIVNAVRTYYTKHRVGALRSTVGDDLPASIIGSFQKVLRYEIKNSYPRNIEGERWYFYDVAVETKGSAGEVIELLPLKFVKRGNAWYWGINSENQVEQLPKGSLTERSISLTTASPSAAAKEPVVQTVPPPSDRETSHRPPSTPRATSFATNTPEPFQNPQQQFEEAVRQAREKWMKAHPNRVMDDATSDQIRSEVAREWTRDAGATTTDNAPQKLSQDQRDRAVKCAASAIVAIKQSAFADLSKLIHPKRGAIIVASPHIDPAANHVFTPEEVAQFDKMQTKFTWDSLCADGEQLTPVEYLKSCIFDHDFTQPKKINVDDDTNGSGSPLNNARQVYPDATSVEAYIRPDEHNDYNWDALRILVEEYNGAWYIVAILRAGWEP